MKILHTSDWHLGKKLGHINRIEEQSIVLNEICEIAENYSVDAVLVAGDIFDTFNPAVEAIELFYSVVKRLSNKGKRPVIVIAGNHDSPDRIEAPNPLARDNGIILIGYPKTKYPLHSTDLPFQISKSDDSFIEMILNSKEKLRIITAPFANEHRMQEAFLIEKDQELVASLTQYWETIANNYCDTSGVNILVGHHLFLPTSDTKVEEPEDEKPIQAISALLPFSCIPKQIQYTAVGHLHRYQIMSKEKHIVYSGSPLGYSFSEASQKKHVVLIQAQANQEVEITPIELATPIPLKRKTFQSSVDAIEWLEQNQDCIIELTIVSDTYLHPQDIKAMHDAHSGIVTIIPQVHIKTTQETVIQNSSEKTIYEHFEEYFMSKKNGQKPNQEIIDMFQKVLSLQGMDK